MIELRVGCDYFLWLLLFYSVCILEIDERIIIFIIEESEFTSENGLLKIASKVETFLETEPL